MTAETSPKADSREIEEASERWRQVSQVSGEGIEEFLARELQDPQVRASFEEAQAESDQHEEAD